MKHTHLYQSQSDLVMVVNVELSLVLGTKEENTINWKIFVLQNFMLQILCQKNFVEADGNEINFDTEISYTCMWPSAIPETQDFEQHGIV